MTQGNKWREKLKLLPFFLFGLLVFASCGVGRMGYYKETERYEIYEVKGGDTLYRISTERGINAAELASLNEIDIKNHTLRVGQRLKVPKNTGSASDAAKGKASEKKAAQSAVAARSQTTEKASSPAQKKAAQQRNGTQKKALASKQSPQKAKTASVIKPGEKLAYRESAPAPKVGATNRQARFQWPVKGVLYSKFGMREGRHHDGIDIAAPKGTPIHAAAEGTVIFSGEHSGYGNIIIIKHEDNLVTVYAHNDKNLVSEGDRVKRGQKIGLVGMTGRVSGAHLHFEVRLNTKPVNPMRYLP